MSDHRPFEDMATEAYREKCLKTYDQSANAIDALIFEAASSGLSFQDATLCQGHKTHMRLSEIQILLSLILEELKKK